MITKRAWTYKILLLTVFLLSIQPEFVESANLNNEFELQSNVSREGQMLNQPRKTNTPKRIALTFDDGPDMVNTPLLLDILKEEGVLATFFVVGNQVERYPEMTLRIFNDGHFIGNHSWTHADLSKLSNEDIINLELAPTSKAIERLTGYYPKVIRPPYGSLREDSVKFLKKEGWQIVRWSLDTFDWDKTRNNPEDIVTRINRGHHSNAIILMHCNGGETVTALPNIIHNLRALGYDFVTVPRLLDLEG